MNATIPAIPTLDVDTAHRSNGWKPNERNNTERKVVWALLHTMLEAHPGRSLAVFDGEETIRCETPRAAMEIIFNLDEATIRMGRSWVFLVIGNGMDIVSDYGLNPATESAVAAAMNFCGLD
jgi:hypothetical protein